MRIVSNPVDINQFQNFNKSNKSYLSHRITDSVLRIINQNIKD